MKRCERCESKMLQEPLADERGSGYSLVCLSCGERLDVYLASNRGVLTPAQIADLLQPPRRGRRPRSCGVSLEDE